MPGSEYFQTDLGISYRWQFGHAGEQMSLGLVSRFRPSIQET